ASWRENRRNFSQCHKMFLAKPQSRKAVEEENLVTFSALASWRENRRNFSRSRRVAKLRSRWDAKEEFLAKPQGRKGEFLAKPQGRKEEFLAKPQGREGEFLAKPQGHKGEFLAKPLIRENLRYLRENKS